eukprot:gene8131-9001_t
MSMKSPNHLSADSPEITRQLYEKRHSLNVIEGNLLGPSPLMKHKRPTSMLGLPNEKSRLRRRLSTIVFRVIVIGSKAVGKTSLVHRYINGDYSDFYSPTVSDVFEKSVLRTEDNSVYNLKIYDTAGDLQYEFPAMYGLTIAEGDMFILIYSVENRKSFATLEKMWMDILQRKDKNIGKLPVVLVGNKSDVSATRRVVTEEEGEALADAIQCPFLEVSAKNGGCHVDGIYESLLQEFEKTDDNNGSSSGRPIEACGFAASVRKGRSNTAQIGKTSFSLKQKRKSFKGRCSVM